MKKTARKTVFINADVWTMDSARPRADSFSFENGIVASVPCRRRKGVEVIDLRGCAVLPGFTDSHAHFANFSLSLDRIDMTGVTDLEKALDLVRAKAKRPGEWIRGRGFVKGGFKGMRFPTRIDLDRAAQDYPAAISSFDGHAMWVNTLALSMAEINRNTPNPSGGEIERDESGEPTGILLENAVKLMMDAIPKPDPDSLARSMEAGQEKALSLGVTALHNFEKAEAFRALQRLHSPGKLRLNVCHYIDEQELDAFATAGVEAGFGDRSLRVIGVKSYADGALNVQTAYMLEPYGSEGGRGILLRDSKAISDLRRRARSMGMPLAVHAIGDAAVKEVVSAFSDRMPGSRFPDRIEHVQHLDSADVARIAASGTAASMQPVHLCYDMDPIDRHLAGRSAFAYMFRSLLDAGVRVAFGSDAPIAPMNPILGLHAAVNRQKQDGSPAGGWHAEQKIGLSEAVACYTSAPAKLTCDFDMRGSITPGKAADFVVLSEPLSGLDSTRISEIRVEQTWIAGEKVFDYS